MTAIVFYFQVHQPWRVRHDWSTPPDDLDGLFDQGLNKMVVERVAERCYLPANRTLLECIEATDGRFRCSFSISGTALAQFERWAPEVIESFRELVDTGSVELCCETSHHSHAALASREEFADQVRSHRANLGRLFGVTPTTFRNTELVLDESIASLVQELGFETLLGEGADDLLAGRSSHLVYEPRGCSGLSLLLRDYVRSDDIAFRFSNEEWPAYPLFADTYARWLADLPPRTPFVGLYMDYETLGEHQWAETGIFGFLRTLPEEILKHDHLTFRTPAELAAEEPATDQVAYPRLFSWADAARDVSAWFGNPMQRAAHEAVYELREAAVEAGRRDPALLEAWRRLTTSDHTYYMSTRFLEGSDGEVHEYFSHHDSPHQAYAWTMRAIDWLSLELGRRPPGLSAARMENQRKEHARRADSNPPEPRVESDDAPESSPSTSGATTGDPS